MKSKYSFYSHDLINLLFKHPYTKRDFLERELSIHRNTAAQYLNTLHDDGFLQKVKLGKSNYYINLSLLELLKDR